MRVVRSLIQYGADECKTVTRDQQTRRVFISQSLFHFDQMRSSHWPILSNEKLPLAHLVKTKRTMTDELATGLESALFVRNERNRIQHNVELVVRYFLSGRAGKKKRAASAASDRKVKN